MTTSARPHARPLLVVDDPGFLRHDTGGGDHPESPARLLAIRRRLAAGPLAKRLAIHHSRPAERAWLTAIHSENYLLRFEEEALVGRSYLGHPDNQMCPETYQTALLAAGAGPRAIDLLEAGEGDLAFCPVRPPGHHAERALPLGFCFLNNIAVAARYWQQRYGRRRIMIIDFDAHHGNGIQAAFEEDPEVLYASIHEHPTWSFPGTGLGEETGSGAGRGATLNLPLPPGSGDETALRLIEERLAPAVAAFRPEALIIGAGFDGHREDDMSGLAYSHEFFRHCGRLVAVWAARHCRGKALTILEGGYPPQLLAEAVETYLTALIDCKEQIL